MEFVECTECGEQFIVKTKIQKMCDECCNAFRSKREKELQEIAKSHDRLNESAIKTGWNRGK